MHEIGHMFVTFLGRGKTLTPPRMYAPVAGSSQGTRGEAGQFLEYLIFGGHVTVLRNPAEGKGQVCSYLPALMEGLSYELMHSLGRHMLP